MDLREILFNKAMVLVLMLEDDGVEVCVVRPNPQNTVWRWMFLQTQTAETSDFLFL